MGRLDGKVAIITGGANGMGATEARMFAQEGAKVVIGDIKEEDGRRLETEINQAGGDVVFIPLDVTKEDDWQRVVDQTVARFGKLNVLVNNAGISQSSFPDHYSTDGWDKLAEVISKGTFLGTKYAVPKMIEAGGGSIVNISSSAALKASAGGHPGYGAAKAAVRLFTKSTAARHGKDGIRANSVHPGRMPPMTSSGRSPEELVAQEQGWNAKTPLGRSGWTEEVGWAVVFLASDEASYITAAELPVDGGSTAV